MDSHTPLDPHEDPQVKRRVLASAGGVLIMFTMIAMLAQCYQDPEILAGAEKKFDDSISMLEAATVKGQMTATASSTKADLKAHAITPKSIAAGMETTTLPSTNTTGDGNTTTVDANTLESSDVILPPGAAIHAAFKGPDAGTIGAGTIGPDGKRTGELADMPSFAFPIIFASVSGVLLVGVVGWLCCWPGAKVA